MEAHKQK